MRYIIVDVDSDGNITHYLGWKALKLDFFWSKTPIKKALAKFSSMKVAMMMIQTLDTEMFFPFTSGIIAIIDSKTYQEKRHFRYGMDEDVGPVILY